MEDEEDVPGAEVEVAIPPVDGDTGVSAAATDEIDIPSREVEGAGLGLV